MADGSKLCASATLSSFLRPTQSSRFASDQRRNVARFTTCQPWLRGSASPSWLAEPLHTSVSSA
eukprot:319660-Prymnesium_polylepis.2